MNEGAPKIEKEGLLVKVANIVSYSPVEFLRLSVEQRRNFVINYLKDYRKQIDIGDPEGYFKENRQQLWMAATDAGILSSRESLELF